MEGENDYKVRQSMYVGMLLATEVENLGVVSRRHWAFKN